MMLPSALVEFEDFWKEKNCVKAICSSGQSWQSDRPALVIINCEYLMRQTLIFFRFKKYILSIFIEENDTNLEVESQEEELFKKKGANVQAYLFNILQASRPIWSNLNIII